MVSQLAKNIDPELRHLAYSDVDFNSEMVIPYGPLAGTGLIFGTTKENIYEQPRPERDLNPQTDLQSVQTP